MELPRGITGFDTIDHPTSPDEKTFHGDCWAVVLPLGGRVIGFPRPMAGPTNNFREILAETPGWRVAILCNAIYPWLGFREPLGPGSLLSRFLDPCELMSGFEATGRYRILRADESNEPLSEEMCHDLGKFEFQQVRYWGKGLRVGDVVFNHWD